MSKIGIIGGSGLYEMPELQVVNEKSVDTPYGMPSSLLRSGTIHSRHDQSQPGAEVVFITRHGGDHSIPPHRVNYRANIAALKNEGVTHIIAVNAVGGIRPEFHAGTIVLPHQIIDYTSGREHTFYDGNKESAYGELEHIDFTQPYDQKLRKILHNSLNEQDAPFICSGIHGVTQGPRLETAVEVDRLERDGCDIVGMTGMPEAALAREAGIAYACLALVVNPAAGRNRDVITMEQVRSVLDKGMPGIRKVIASTCQKIAREISIAEKN